MKTLNLIIVVSTIFLAACGKSGGDQSGTYGKAPGSVDHTIHTYNVVAFINNANAGAVTMHQVCNFGLAAGFRDETTSVGLSQPSNLSGGVGAANCENYTVDLTNMGADNLLISISVDGVNLPDVTVSPAQSYSFQRGF